MFALLKFRIYFDFYFKWFFIFISVSSVSLTTDFYNSILTSFFCFTCFNLASFFIVSCCNSNFTIFTCSYFFSLTSFKIFIIDIFSIEWFFYNFCYRFNTNSNFPIFFFCNCFSCFRSFSITISYISCNCHFFLTNYTFFIYNLASGIKIFIISYLSFVRNIFFHSLYC